MAAMICFESPPVVGPRVEPRLISDLNPRVDQAAACGTNAVRNPCCSCSREHECGLGARVATHPLLAQTEAKPHISWTAAFRDSVIPDRTIAAATIRIAARGAAADDATAYQADDAVLELGTDWP